MHFNKNLSHNNFHFVENSHMTRNVVTYLDCMNTSSCVNRLSSNKEIGVENPTLHSRLLLWEHSSLLHLSKDTPTLQRFLQADLLSDFGHSSLQGSLINYPKFSVLFSIMSPFDCVDFNYLFNGIS